MDTHKNAPLTPKGREAMVRRVVEEGLSKAAAAGQFNVSAKTVAKWVKRFRAEGVNGLRDRSSRPRKRDGRPRLSLPVGRIVWGCSLARASLVPGLQAPKRVRVESNFAKRFKLIGRSRCAHKNISLSLFPKLCFNPPVPHRHKGRIAIVTNVARNAVDARRADRRAARARTAKSCGPGAPMQALSFVTMRSALHG